MDKLNVKLSGLLDSLNKNTIQKTSSLGNFADVKDFEEVAKVAKMTNEMLALPKYQPIMSKLKGSTGVVNFVTHDEYQPLIELMLKRVFPATNNDIFNMGQQEASGEEYFVSPEYFAKNIIQGSPQHVVKSRQRLEDLLLGSKVKITRKWLKEVKNFSDEEIQTMLGSPNQDAAIAQAMEAQARGGQVPRINQLGVAVTMYERGMAEISEKYDGPIQQLNKEILEHNLGEREMKPADLAKKKEQRDIWIGLKRSEIDNLNSTIGENIVVEKWYPGKAERNSDGFISFSPQDEVIDASYELARKVQFYFSGQNQKTIQTDTNFALKAENEILRSIMNLKTKMDDYQTSNPRLRKIKEQFIAFLGNGSHDDYLRIASNIAGMYMQLQHAFASSIKKQGKVLILDDFDKSALCTRAGAGVGAGSNSISLDDVSRSVFLDFVGKNSSNLERDDSQGKRERGNRIVIVLSSEKISNLPSCTTIEMDIAPVDIEEAEIIVRNILAQYSKEALMNLKRRLHREIDEKHGNKSSPQKGFEKETISEQVESQAGTLGNLSDETRKKMIGMIIGLSQRDAINSIRMAIQSGIKYEDEEDIISPTMAFEEKDIIKNLRDTVNTRLSTDVMGLTVMEPEVAFEDYAYKRTSEWANRVMSLKDVRDEMVDLKECVKANEQRIVNIDKDIKISNKLPAGNKNKLDPEDIKALMAERQGLVNQTAHYRVDLNSIAANDLPHVYILYGLPGTGKSIWAHALASLLKLNIRSVDIGAQKDMWLGNTEKNCIRLFNTMKSSRDTIYLIDEIDKQVESRKDQGPSTHETTKEIVARFLELFDNTENERKFRQNNVFFIMTTNNVEGINTALMQRVSETYHVELPDLPEDYEKFFRSYLNVERGRFPEDPWFCDEDDKTIEECWTSTMEMLNSLDWKKISVVFAQKQIDFRSLKKMLQQAFNEHRAWRIRSRIIGKGKIVEPRGLPLTTQNLVDIGNIISTGAESNDSFKLGVGQLASERAEQVRKMMEPYASGQKKLETMTVTDPHTGKVETRFKLPDDVMKIMTGETQAEMEKETPQEGWEYKREVDPATGQIKTELKPKEKKIDPTKEMEELKDKGFKEEPLIDTEQKKTTVQEKGKETKKKEDVKTKEEKPITSSTDYLFDYLGKKGLIRDNKFIVPVKKAKVIKDAQTQNVQPEKQDNVVDDSGVYNFGFIMIAPGAGNVPSQQIKTEMEKGVK